MLLRQNQISPHCHTALWSCCVFARMDNILAEQVTNQEVHVIKGYPEDVVHITWRKGSSLLRAIQVIPIGVLSSLLRFRPMAQHLSEKASIGHNTVRLWDIYDTHNYRQYLELQYGFCSRSIAFSPDGTILAYALSRVNRTVNVCGMLQQNFYQISSTAMATVMMVLSVAFSPDGTTHRFVDRKRMVRFYYGILAAKDQTILTHS